ncbi:MAG: 5-bromo-4-chloroindolyl phosphate hydrolysis family protein [Eggerthellaceae bacterium]
MSNSKNIGDQVRDAIQDAIDSQDYSNLKNTVERSIESAADVIGQSLRQAAQAAQNASNQRNATRAFELQKQQQRIARQQQEAELANRYASVSGNKAGAYIAAGLGGAVGAIFTALSVMVAPFAIASASALGAVSGIIMGAVVLPALVGIGVCVFGAKRAQLLKRFDRYRKVLGMREACSVGELAAQTAQRENAVVKDLRTFIDKGWLRHGRMDDAETQLMVTDGAYEQYRALLAQGQERERQQRLAQAQVERKQAGRAALDNETRAILEKGEAFVAQIRESNDAIPGEEISAKIDQIESVVRSILKRAEEHPEVIPELDRLMDYYLPTTVKLLDAYEELDAQPIQGENILKSKAEIEGTLDTLSVAFEKLLDSIFVDVAWDVSTDVSVLHAVLAQEGLVADPFKKK